MKCADRAVEAATTKNFKRFGASTNSCGAKLLSSGEYLETYLVCVSDETDPSEWVVVIQKTVTDKQQRATGTCGVKYAEQQYDSSTPNFESADGLLKTVGCTADYGGDGKVHCK